MARVFQTGPRNRAPRDRKAARKKGVTASATAQYVKRFAAPLVVGLGLWICPVELPCGLGLWICPADLACGPMPSPIRPEPCRVDVSATAPGSQSGPNLTPNPHQSQGINAQRGRSEHPGILGNMAVGTQNGVPAKCPKPDIASSSRARHLPGQPWHLPRPPRHVIPGGSRDYSSINWALACDMNPAIFARMVSALALSPRSAATLRTTSS